MAQVTALRTLQVVDVRVLGPVEVGGEGGPVALGPPKERSLFALLVVHANKVVSVDRLADELWDGSPPDQAVAAVRVYVSHLRKVLPEGRLLTKGSGYELLVDDDELDAARFEHRAAEGRTQLEGGEASTAAATLRAALAEWRGAAFDGVQPTASVAAETSRLVEERLGVLEDRIDADLQYGRHREVVGELTTLVGEHPLRERLWGQLIVALYRCGRQADALRAYQQARSKLVEELGIDPSAELRRIEAMVLTQDTALDAPGSAAARPATRHNLPAPRTPFVGRERERARVLDLLDNARLVTLTGIGGCGKTRLALDAAAARLDRFPDGVVLIELATVTDPGAVASAVVAAIGLDTSNLTTSIDERLAEFLVRRQTLLIFDNCEHVIDAVARLVDLVLRDAPNLVVLATSREALEVDGEHAWRVPSMSEADGVELFRSCARRVRPELQIESDLDSVLQICRRLDCVPLALELAAARLKSMSLKQIADRLDDRFRLLTGGARTALPRQQTLEATMDWSHDLLDDAERRVFRRLSVFAGGFTADAAEAIAGADLNVLDRLVDKSLVVVDPDVGRYELLETVRQYARQKLLESGESDATRALHRVWFTEFADSIALQAYANVVAYDAARDSDNFRAALAWSLDGDDIESALRIVAPLSMLGYWEGRLHEGLSDLETVLARWTGEVTPHYVEAVNSLGSLQWWIGLTATAGETLRRAGKLARQIDDRNSRFRADYLLGMFYATQGLEEAEPLLETARAGFEATNNPCLAWANFGLGFVASQRKDFDRAMSCHEQAVALGRAFAGDVSVRPAALAQLAYVSLMSGNKERALALAREAVDAADGMNSWVYRIVASAALSDIAIASGDDDLAVSMAIQNLRLLRDSGGVITLAWGLTSFAISTRNTVAPDVTARLLGAAESATEVASLNEGYPVFRQAVLESAREALGDEAFDMAWQEGRRMTGLEAVDYALAAT